MNVELWLKYCGLGHNASQQRSKKRSSQVNYEGDVWTHTNVQNTRTNIGDNINNQQRDTRPNLGMWQVHVLGDLNVGFCNIFKHFYLQ